MKILFISTFVVVPTLLTILYLKSLPRYQGQSKRIWVTFGISILGSFLVLFVNSVALTILLLIYEFSTPLRFALIWTLFAVAIPEACLKMLVIKFCMRKKFIEKLMDGLVYGAAASVGFAPLDYYMCLTNLIIPSVIYSIMITLFQVMIGAIMGYHLTKRKFDKQARCKHLVLALIFPVGLHTLFNFSIYLTLGVHEGGSNMWIPIYIFFKTFSLIAILITILLYKKYLSEAREELKSECPDDSSSNVLKKNERFM